LPITARVCPNFFREIFDAPVPPLDSHNGIPENKRHSSCQGNPWTQITEQYNALHSVHKLNDDEFTAVVAHSEEVCKLVEGGFSFVCDFGANKIFKKRNKLLAFASTGDH